MKPYFYTAVLIITILLPLSTHADTFCVSDATGLQTAFTTAAGNGEDDTVQIEQGTYVGSFIYASTEAFNLTVEGGYTGSCSSQVVDPANTVLDANGTGSALVLSAPTTNANLVVDGLTLQNGVAGNGSGGGIYANTSGDVTISNNTITGNTASSYRGGGVYAYSSSGTIMLTNNTITGNTASSHGGGGVYAYSSSGTIMLTNNTITENSSNGPGGGFHAYSSSGTIMLTNNTITGNTASSHGGGVYPYSSSGTIMLTNNTITGNSAPYGGGVYADSSSGTIMLTNNTITENSATNGGGLRIKLQENDVVADIINNIIWNNTASDSANDLYINNDGNGDYFPSTVNLYNNDFDQSSDGTYIELPFTIDPSNLDNEDPLFVDAPNDDYHLTDLSPCIDQGRLEGAPADDMDGHSRPQGDGVDIGADEYIPPDADEDGVPNDEDNCPTDSNPAQTDTDHDCIGDECDDFPNDYDPTVPDSDGDGVGNDCDVCPYDFDDDIDADGLCANEDNCPDIPNGPDLGSCINILTGVVGTTCMNDGECGSGETCSNDQEDRNNNGSGDTCDIGTFCRGLADYDQDVDANDVTVFLSHFGRSIFSNPCPPDGPSPVPQTGQTTSYATGDDGDLERGVPLVTPRFTDNGDGTVTDNQTGLIWLKNANCFGTRTWADAISDCNGLTSGSCGLTDGSNAGAWRLPNKRELISVTHDAYYNPAVSDTEGTGQWSEGDPFTNVQNVHYWSSTKDANVIHTDSAWYVDLGDGYVNFSNKTSAYYVWPVRGGH